MKRPLIIRVLAGITTLIALDQLTKFWIVTTIPQNEIGFSFLGSFFRIIHVRNLGVAFSLGNDLPDLLRGLFFVIVPLLFLSYLFYALIMNAPFLQASRVLWLNRLALVFVIGGGLGNLVDRLFREGVVDFVDVEFYGLLGLERWPAFNLADSWVFIGAVCWLVASFLTSSAKERI